MASSTTRSARSLSDAAKHGRPSNLLNHQQSIPPVPSIPPYMRRGFNSSSPAKIDTVTTSQAQQGSNSSLNVGLSPTQLQTQSQTSLTSSASDVIKVLNPKTHQRRSSSSSEIHHAYGHGQVCGNQEVMRRARRSSSFISTTGSFPPPGLINHRTPSPSSNGGQGPDGFAFSPTQSLVKDKNGGDKKNFKNKVKGWEVEKSFEKIKFDGWEAGLADLLEMENNRPSTKIRNVNKHQAEGSSSSSRLLPNSNKLSSSKSQNNLAESANASASNSKGSTFGFRAKLTGGLLLSKAKK